MAGDWRASLEPGSILGNLRFIKRLGSGGMGEVFLAEDPKGSRVAVKVLDPSVAGSESGSLDRLLHEAEFARNVSNKIIFMDQGRVIEAGPTREFFANPKEERSRSFIRSILNKE